MIKWYLVGIVGFFMVLAVQRFIKAIMIKDDAGRDHCELAFAILLVAMVDALLR